MGTATADFDDILVKYVKGIYTGRDTSALNLLMTQLPKVVSAPRIYMSNLYPLFNSSSCDCLLLCIHCNGYCEILATSKLLNSVIFQGFYEARRTCSQRCSLVVRKIDIVLNTKLAEIVGSHHVEMPLVCYNSRVPFSTSNLLDYDIKTARPWNFYVSGFLTILRRKFGL